eukprot:1748807-Prymnesium_polylepis.1
MEIREGPLVPEAPQGARSARHHAPGRIIGHRPGGAEAPPRKSALKSRRLKSRRRKSRRIRGSSPSRAAK